MLLKLSTTYCRVKGLFVKLHFLLSTLFVVVVSLFCKLDEDKLVLRQSCMWGNKYGATVDKALEHLWLYKYEIFFCSLKGRKRNQCEASESQKTLLKVNIYISMETKTNKVAPFHSYFV